MENVLVDETEVDDCLKAKIRRVSKFARLQNFDAPLMECIGSCLRILWADLLDKM